MYKYGRLVMNFEWDLQKERLNVKKHGIRFSLSVETFKDPFGFAMTDQKHSEAERRFYWIGKSLDGRILTTWYTHRNENTIRIIGCSEWRKMRKLYESTKAKRFKD